MEWRELFIKGMKKNFRQRFLENTDETGRHIVYSTRTGKSYCVEPIGNGRGGDWGSVVPGQKDLSHKKGDGKYTGSVTEKESMITKKNGFKEQNIHFVENGSPYSVIEELDAKHPSL